MWSGANQIVATSTFTVNDVNAAPTIEFSDIIENDIVKFTSVDILNRITDPNADSLTYASITSLTIVDKSTGSAIPNATFFVKMIVVLHCLPLHSLLGILVQLL